MKFTKKELQKLRSQQKMSDNIRINLLTNDISHKDEYIDKLERALSRIKVLIECGIVENEIKGYSTINLSEIYKTIERTGIE